MMQLASQKTINKNSHLDLFFSFELTQTGKLGTPNKQHLRLLNTCRPLPIYQTWQRRERKKKKKPNHPLDVSNGLIIRLRGCCRDIRWRGSGSWCLSWCLYSNLSLYASNIFSPQWGCLLIPVLSKYCTEQHKTKWYMTNFMMLNIFLSYTIFGE